MNTTDWPKRICSRPSDWHMWHNSKTFNPRHMHSLYVRMCCCHSRKGSQVADLLDMFASMLEEPELGGCGQANGECILSSWQLLNIKDGMVGLQED